MFGLSMQELMIIGVVALLLFGKKLPEVARSLGKSYTEFRKGLSDIQSNFDVGLSSSSSSSYRSKPTYNDYDDYDEATAPKFAPPPSEPPAAPGAEANANAEGGSTPQVS